MKFISLDQMPNRSPDRNFKTSSFNKLFALICVLTAIVVILLGKHGPLRKFELSMIAQVGIALFLLLFVSLVGSDFRKTLLPTNWLIQTRGNTIWIKYRSYANERMDTSDQQIVEIDRHEIAWIRRAKVRTTTQTINGWERQTTTTPQAL